MQGIQAISDRRTTPGNAPCVEIGDARYSVRFADSGEEIEAALKLRFEVFNLELGEGLASSFQTGRDRDEFDATCHHLIAAEKATGKVVGTYRLRTIEIAGSAAGFYSAGEFDLHCLRPDVLNVSVEVGRACIALEHRNRQVLFLLWRGLAQFMSSHRKRFLFGCCSLTSQDPAEGIQMLAQLERGGYMHPTLLVPPQPGYECIAGGAATPRTADLKIPRLFATYLSIGARVCSAPALDRRFKTIDFFVVFDLEAMDQKTRRQFFAA